MGGGKTTSSTTSDKETMATTKLLREGVQEPIIKDYMPQFLNFLRGRASPQNTPILQSQVSGIQSGTSSAIEAIKAMLAKSGLIGTPFGARQLAQTQQQGSTAAASVGPDLALEMFRSAPGLLTGTSNVIMQGRGQTTTQKESGGGMDIFGSLLGNVLGAGIMRYCWLAAATFGPLSPKVMAARYWISRTWPKPLITLYSRFGKRLSRSRLVVTLLSPYFEYAAKKGGKVMYG